MEILFHMWRFDFEWFLSTKYSASSLGWYCWWFRNPIPNHLGWCLNLVNNGISNTNLNWFSRRISDINNMPPKKEGSFLRFPNHGFQQFGCVKCVFFVGFFCRFCAEIPSLKPNIFCNLKKWMAKDGRLFSFSFLGKPGFLEGYLNPTPRRPIQATGGLSQITLAMPNEAVNPVPLKKRGSLGPSYVSEKVRLKSHMISMPCINQYCTWFCNGVCVYISSVCI